MEAQWISNSHGIRWRGDVGGASFCASTAGAGAPISARAAPLQAPLVQLPLPLQLRRAWASRGLQGWAAFWHL